MSSGWADLSRDGRRGTPITGIGELITNDRDDGTYATLNNAALVISGDRVTWAGPASRASAADRAGRTDGPTPLEPSGCHNHRFPVRATDGAARRGERTTGRSGITVRIGIT